MSEYQTVNLENENELSEIRVGDRVRVARAGGAGVSKPVRDEALRRTMWQVGHCSNDVTQYISDAVAEKVVQDEEKERTGYASVLISLDDYRRDAMRTYPYELVRNERRDYAAMKLSEEAAEVMALVNKSQYQGEPYSRERIRDELGDVWWALNVNLVEHGLTLDEIMLANMAKRRIKYPPEGV